MNLLDALIKIFPSLKKFKGEINFFSGNKLQKTEIIINNPVININVNSLDKAEKITIQEAIRSSLQGDVPLLMESKSELLLRDFQSVERADTELVSFFRGKIPMGDVVILRASLFLKNQYETNKPVDKLKNDIVNKYGERGRNISNLCSAGYFDSYIRPLFKEIASKKSRHSIQKFQELYEIIVTQFPFAIFVNRGMSSDELKMLILEKIELNKKYGIKYLDIHGISRGNVQKITEILGQNELQKELTSLPEILSGQKYIHVRIWFRCPDEFEEDQSYGFLSCS